MADADSGTDGFSHVQGQAVQSQSIRRTASFYLVCRGRGSLPLNSALSQRGSGAQCCPVSRELGRQACPGAGLASKGPADTLLGNGCDPAHPGDRDWLTMATDH
ncbi:hypothetical protein ANANG_G00156840 [Anguilla anguilla]|uniref:Uncharacterized protein n=1 Tax=Anguilla anguilla TaxID=7936 RepID=A0A9D3RWB2_ANGAN|nr:hypothetical protein ANANG_G00156840 [Anguilla anguilla]